MDFGEELLSKYIKENGGCQGHQSVEQAEMFVFLANDLNVYHKDETYKDKKIARKKLKRRAVQSIGLIQYFILRAIIGWIIDQILSHYWGK